MPDTKIQPEEPSSLIVYAVFAVGMVSALAFRAIIVFEHIDRAWIRPVWYLGTIGYILFFFNRYLASERRKRIIAGHDLIAKLSANACLADEDRRALLRLLSSLQATLEDKNYLAIFILSIIAIVTDIVLSSFK